MQLPESNFDKIHPYIRRNCAKTTDAVFEFEPTKENPDEECINCILDHILRQEEGEIRDACIAFYKTGMMKLNCSRTRKSYMVTKEFFDKINPSKP